MGRAKNSAHLTTSRRRCGDLLAEPHRRERGERGAEEAVMFLESRIEKAKSCDEAKDDCFHTCRAENIAQRRRRGAKRRQILSRHRSNRPRLLCWPNLLGLLQAKYDYIAFPSLE